jgi:IclR family transcriptional regulator, acetate operon repressor
MPAQNHDSVPAPVDGSEDDLTGPGAGLGRPKYPIGSVDSALRLLLLISSRSEIRLADASRELGVGRSTAHRLMQMLEFYGFAAQNAETRAYVPGPVLTNAGMRLVGDVDLKEAARPHVEALVGRVQETVHLQSLRRDGLVICLDSIEGPQALRVGSRTGQVLPAHGTAGGHALLATLTDDTIEQLFPGPQLEKFTESTVTSRAALLSELHQVRERGYGISHGGYVRDVSGIGVAVPDPMARTRLAIAVAVPTSRFDDKHVANIVAEAKEYARRISLSIAP